MSRDGRLSLGIIGAGRVGPVLGAGLAAAGHRIVGVHAVSEHSRDRVQALLPGAPLLQVPELIAASDLVLLAVPDGELPELIRGLAAVDAWHPGQLVVHTSARHGVGVLAPAQAQGVIPLAIHPAMRFTGTSIDLQRLRDAWCAVTAPTPVLPIAQALVVELGAEPIVISERDRERYAEAIEIATEFPMAIAEQAMAALREAGVEHPGAVIAPLLHSSLDGALDSGRTAAADPMDAAGFDQEEPLP